MRPYVTAGVALVGASVISVTPIAPQMLAERASEQYVTLTAAAGALCEPESTSPLCADPGQVNSPMTTSAVFGESSLAYIPGNLINALLSIPAWEIQAMDRLADAMIGTGSWQVWGPTNVFGFDQWDPPKLKAFVDMLVPFKPFSSVLGEQMSVWAQANLPMNSGCAGTPGACPDMSMLLASMFKVPMSQLYEGYTFPEAGEQGSTNPFDGSTVPWAGQTVKLEPWGPFKSSWEWLTSPPEPVETVPLSDFVRVPLKLAKAMFDAFNPFVQNSSIFNPRNGLVAVVAKALAPLFCKNCDLDNLYDNPWLYDNYNPHPPIPEAESQGSETAADVAAEAAADEPDSQDSEGTEGTEEAGPTDPTEAAVASLLDKFQSVGAEDEDADTEEAPEEEPAEEPAEESVDDVDEAPDVEAEDADESGTGKHHLGDGDEDNSVKSIKDKVGAEKDSGSDSDSDSGSGGDGSDD